MADKIALNKTSLKKQRDQLKLYQRYLPSLDLKRQQLMIEHKKSRRALEECAAAIRLEEARLDEWVDLISSSDLTLDGFLSVERIDLGEENVVGVRLPVVRDLAFALRSYSTLATPAWVDRLVDGLTVMARLRVELRVRERRAALLEEAVRKITQRVNLFEKVLIPRSRRDIRRIQIYLSDNERAAVCRSKLAKAKGLVSSRVPPDALVIEEDLLFPGAPA